MREDVNSIFHRPFRTDYVLGREPGTLCRANFQLSLWDEAAAISPVMEELIVLLISFQSLLHQINAGAKKIFILHNPIFAPRD